MRQIRFRAWHENMKQYFLNLFIDFSGNIGVWNNEESEIDFSLYPFLVLEQFTGLLDKNGKEIYEGDILKSDTYKVVWVIFWNDTSARLEVKDANGLLPAELCYINLQIHYVIGNIHENPELLK
jgi:hypothetical protein